VAKVGWVLLALVLTLVVYYALETLYFIVGDSLVGAISFENSGAPDWRILLLPIAGFIAFRLLWSRIRGPKAA
jgi:hypothetical protein